MSIRLVIMGTGPFAVPMSSAIYETSHEVAALVTQPRRGGHGKRAAANPMRELAQRHRTPVLDPEDLNTDESRADLARYEPDLLVVTDYGQILAPETLAVAPHGGINLHGSLLPKYRGAAPINWAIYHGETETGVTIIHMTPRCDAGPCLARETTPIDPEETAVELEERLAGIGAVLICKTLDDISAGTTRTIDQDSTQVSRARRLRKSDGSVDWSRSAVAIKNQVRAMQPWPTTFTYWHRPGKEPLRLILDRVEALTETTIASPGTVVTADGGVLEVATGDGTIGLESVQPAGKRLLSSNELLRGYPVEVGHLLGPAERSGLL